MRRATTNFLNDGSNVTEEMQGTTTTADYGSNAEKLSGTVYWMLQDGQPSTRQLLNSSQAIVSAYTTDAYGNNISSSGTAANPFKWNGGSGYYSDSESGLQKVGARYYDPSVGSWISQDTMLIAGSVADSQAVNRYLYCGANPIGRVDPRGHASGPGDDDINQGIALIKGAAVALILVGLIAIISSVFSLGLSTAAMWVAAACASGVAAIGALLIWAGMELNYSFFYSQKHPGSYPPPQTPPPIPIPGAAGSP